MNTTSSGALSKEAKHILGKTYTTGYTYDKAGNFTAITYPSGRKVIYSLDKLNRPTGVSANLKNMLTLASNFVYDSVSNLKSNTLGNGLTQTWTYDPANRISTITVPGVMNVNYAFDPAGNITNITNQLDPTKSKTYTYDALDRPASATGPWGTLARTYDANGNRLTQADGIKYTYAIRQTDSQR